MSTLEKGQTCITESFREVKKDKVKSFYGKLYGPDGEKRDFTNAVIRASSSLRYVPKTKKLMELSSEDDSDSDSDFNFNSKPQTPSSLKNNTTVKSTPSKRTRQKSINGHECSPSKQSKSTPKVSRKKSSGEKINYPKTPTTPFSRLHVDTDETENREESSVSKKLFSSDKYQTARKALHSSIPENLPGREAEINELSSFISTHIVNNTSGSLYVSGPPGTGKTACLSTIICKPEFSNSLKTVYINCTTIKSANSVYAKIVKELNLEAPRLLRECKSVIEKYLASSKKKALLLVLDEIDQLSSRNQEVLYSIFEWPVKAKSKLILVGIANALDLTERILPRLQARCEIKPKVMNFAPYTIDQILQIIKDRLQQANVNNVFSEGALQFLARKMSAMSGDIRRVLDISRRVIELVDSRKNTAVLQPANDNESNIHGEKIPQESDAKVDIKDILSSLQAIYGGSEKIDEEESTFPLQQKILLCSLMLILEKSKNKDVTIGRLYEVYRKVCIKRRINVLDNSEFKNLCNLIEDCGILRVIAKKDTRTSKVVLQWDQDQLTAALKDKNLTSDIISDVSCL